VQVSVIVTTYKRADRLRLCLLALENQSFRDFECIVIDDGSHDESFVIFRRWADDTKLPSYYAWEQDTGFRLSHARNLGARMARGDGLIFIDSDILLNPWAIENYARLLSENPNRAIGGYYRYLKGMVILPRDVTEWDRLWRMELPEVDIPQDAYQFLGNDVRETHFMQGWASEDLFRNESEVWRAPFSLLGGNMMISRVVWREIQGFAEEICHYGGEDAEISIQIAQAGFGFSYSKSAGGAHMAHSKFENAEKGTFDSIAWMTKRWPLWFPNGEPLWSKPGWEVPPRE